MGGESKKRKASGSSSAEESRKKANQAVMDFDRPALHAEIGYEEMSMADIHARLADLCRRVPMIPENGFLLEDSNDTGDSETASDSNGISGAPKVPQPQEPLEYSKPALRQWAMTMQSVMEEFHLIIACVSPATYAWGTDRSGAADQNLGLLSSEFLRAQEQVHARVTPRLNDVLAPVVTLLTDKTVTVKDSDGKETKQNYFINTHEDPDYVNLCFRMLAKNAASMRQVVLANFDKLLRAIHDFLQAQVKDDQHDSRGFVY